MTDLLFVPYVEGGRSWKGADCWGLVMLCYEHYFGITVPDYGDIVYHPKELPDSASKGLLEALPHSKFQPVERPKFGDWCLINVNGCPVHIGFMLNERDMIHSSAGKGVSVADVTSPQYNRRIYGFYRHEDLQ